MSASLAVVMLWGCAGAPEPVLVAPPPEPVEVPADGLTRYVLRFDKAQAHLIDVEATFPTGGAASIELMMATWTPGSYLVRDYARNIEGLRVNGSPPSKVAKNRWQIPTGGQAAVRVDYTLYAREMSVQENFVDADLAMLNGAPTFLARVGALDQPAEVVIVPRADWPDVQTGLDPVPDAEHTFRARNLDELIDSPIVAGDLDVYTFEVEGIEHRLVNALEDEIWDGPRSAADVETITRAQIDFWGEIPYDRYVYLNVIGEAGGGLEHERSTLMLTSRWRSRNEEEHKRWLGLVSHEFFHTWNVKRLRPVELGPFDYEREVLTENLWIAEGFTSYYDDLLLVRAGLLDESDWLARTNENIRRLQETPGRLVHPLQETSRDAWIKFYRRDTNNKNTSISYYTKGAVVAFLLDAKIRESTAGMRSLDDVMRLAYTRFSDEAGYTSEAFRATTSEVAKTDLTDFFARAVDGTEELEYAPALAWYGLRFAPTDEASEDTDATTDEAEPGWIGLQVSGSRVHQVLRGTPAYDAGFNIDDEVIAVDGYRVGNGGWSDRMSRYDVGDEVEVLIARRGALRTLQITLDREPSYAFELEIDPEAPSVAAERRKRLLAP